MAASSISSLFSFFKPSSVPPKASLSHLSLSSSSAATTPLVSSSSSSSNELQTNTSSSSPDIMSVVCPSLAYANTLFFRSAYNVQVMVDDYEPEEKLLGRFRREVIRAGVIQECKRRRFFENKQDEKKRRSLEAAKRNRRRRPESRNFTEDDRQETPGNKEEEEDDNWDLPEADLPY